MIRSQMYHELQEPAPVELLVLYFQEVDRAAVSADVPTSASIIYTPCGSRKDGSHPKAARAFEESTVPSSSAML